MHKTTVDLGDRSYPIYLGIDILERLADVYRASALPSSVAIVTDSNVAKLHLRKLSAVLHRCGIHTSSMLVPPGERQKSLARANGLYTRLLMQQFPRSDALIAFGGGVVGDLAGFVASTYRRGLPFIQIPTTLLAQVESSIGGKTGVNHLLAKNAVGTFYQPRFVFSDVRFLSTLAPRELICGLGEVIKYGYLDEGMFKFLERHLEDVLRMNLDVIEDVVFRCNALKAGMVSGDERETNATGGRMLLNLGHTIGQALEVLSNYRLRHGEAVLIGLQLELMIAREARLITSADATRIGALLQRTGFEPRPQNLHLQALIKNVFRGKNKPRFILPTAIGHVIATNEIEQSLVRHVIRSFSGK